MSTAKQQIFHEVAADGQHRLVITNGKEPARSSQWYEGREVGLFRGYHFTTLHLTGGLTGVFRVSRQVYEAL
jgi:hypothetical protein